MIDNEKQREFFTALAKALSEDAANKGIKEDEFAKTSFRLFTSLVKAGFTDEQAIGLMSAIIGAVARS